MSRTTTITVNEQLKTIKKEENNENNIQTITLSLKPKKNVTWQEDTVDNEHMGKRKSKICCIFKRPRLNPDDTSTDESCDSCDEKGKNAYERPNHYERLDKNKPHKHNKGGHGGGCCK